MSDVKESFYRNFEQALSAMKDGRKVAREEWNFFDDCSHLVFVSLCPGVADLPSEKFWNPHNRKFAEELGTACVEPYFSKVTEAATVMMGWVPTAADILAEDWLILAD